MHEHGEEPSIYEVPTIQVHAPGWMAKGVGTKFVSNMPSLAGDTVGARITMDSRCRVCDNVFQENDIISIVCAADFDAALLTHARCNQ